MTLQRKQPKGATAIISAMAVGTFAIVILTSTSVAALGTFSGTNDRITSEQTFLDAETGLQEALYRLWLSPSPTAFTLNANGTTIDVTTAVDPGNAYRRTITSRATDPTGIIRTVRIIANTNAFAGGFDFAVQGGAGGVFLDNNSRIVGKVHSNGSVLPASGGATGNVTSDVWVANGNLLRRVRVNGDAYAHAIEQSSVCGNAYYQTIDAASTAFLNSPTQPPCTAVTPGTAFPGTPDPAPKPLPITDANVQQWKDEITAAGHPVLLPNPLGCPHSHNVGTYCVNDADMTHGVQKVDGDFYVGNGRTLTLTGNLWVTGKIFLDNNGAIRLDPSLAEGSAVIIADGIIKVNNNYTMTGSGDPRSFLLVLSTNPSIDLAAPAIFASNNSTSIIFAAIHGMLKVKNNGSLNAAAADTLYLEPNSTVMYNPNLAAFTVPSGGGNAVGTAIGTWEEL